MMIHSADDRLLKSHVNAMEIPSFVRSGRHVARLANEMSDSVFNRKPGGKWSVAETLQHLYLSARPVLRLMNGPRDVFRQWPVASRASRSYEEIADLYRQALATGVKAPEAMLPRAADMAVDQATVIGRFIDVYESLGAAAALWPENELDGYQLPHPALGLVTVREMLDFVDIHTHHHLASLVDQLP
jgi:hypothetical protein